MPAFMFIGGKNPGSQTITATGSGTFTVPYFAENLRVRLWGPGGSGQAQNTSRTTFTNGNAGSGATTFSAPGGTLSGGAGGAGASGFAGAGGTASGGSTNTNGENGGPTGSFSGSGQAVGYGGAAGGTTVGGGARAEGAASTARSGQDGNSYGGGGSGATGRNNNFTPADQTTPGGGGGGFVEKIYQPGDLNIGSSISYNVGAGGAAATAGTQTSGKGADGAIIIEWDY